MKCFIKYYHRKQLQILTFFDNDFSKVEQLGFDLQF